ncbi:MAG: endonuclease [Bacteroidia bacterium]
MNFSFLKQSLIAVCALASANQVYAQAVLPTSFDFDETIPDGWTEALQGGNFRYATGQAGTACRLDETGDYVEVYLADVPGTVSYYIKGQGSAVTNDTFNIQESANGTTWTNMRQLIGNQVDMAAYVQYNDQPAATSRYIRWYFKRKQSGKNISLDEITIAIPAPTNAQEIAVLFNGTAAPSNNPVVVGNATTHTIRIQNAGLADDLTVSGVTFSGAAAADYSIASLSVPFDVSAQNHVDLTLNFNAGGSGSRTATMTIANNDFNGDETSYTVELLGIGGNYATEPSAQASALSFTNVKSYKMTVGFTAALPAPENYIVLRKTGSAVTETPVDGTTYVAGDWVGGAKVMYVGNATSFSPREIIANTDFHYAVFAFNGPAGYENYLTTSPLAGNVTTPDGDIQNYYNGITATDANLLTLLQNTLSNGQNQIYYSNYGSTIIRDFVERDTTDGAKVVNCVYSNYAHIYTGNFNYDVISREHTYAHSWMDTWPGEDGLEYSDLHNLFPAHQNNANAVRSNLPLDEVVTVTSTFLEGTYGKNAAGQDVYEPRDSHKGDAARAMFYMATRYNGTGGNWGFPNPISFTTDYGQNQDVLKAWHWQDPPSKWEIARNDYVESKQNNRNPFVDSVNFVCYINFDDMTYIANPGVNPCSVTPGFEETNVETFSVYPNPTAGEFGVNISLKENETVTVRISDVAGKTVYERNENLKAGNNRLMISSSRLSKGIYMLQLLSENTINTQKIVIK